MTNLFDNEPLDMKEVLEDTIRLEMRHSAPETTHLGVLKPLDYNRYAKSRESTDNHWLNDYL